MNTKKIKNLIEILKESDLHSLAYKDEEFEIELVMPGNQILAANNLTHVVASKEEDNSPLALDNTINSVLVGVFYSKPSPDAAPFVSVGQSVNEGDVICIIEAMKVMNEIVALKSGVIEAIHVQDGEAVDYDQVLFTIK